MFLLGLYWFLPLVMHIFNACRSGNIQTDTTTRGNFFCFHGLLFEGVYGWKPACRINSSIVYFYFTQWVSPVYLNIIWLRGVSLCQTMRVVYLLVLAGFLAITGLAFLIAGIVLLSKDDASCSEGSSNTSNRKSLNSAPGRKSLNLTERCSYSEEAITKGLDKFLQKVQDSYYKLHPNKISSKPKVSSAEIQAKYRSYDPSPQNIKIITDKALALLDEINAIIFESHKLKPRERKALAQVKHYLQHIFGTPYDVNYYAGDFLLGPNLWCWQPLCDTRSEMKNSLYHFKPNSTEDLENLLKKFGEIKETFVQYRKNMEYGVLVGMVRSVEQCKAGINGLTSYFREISIKGAKGKNFFNVNQTFDVIGSSIYIF